MSDPERPDAEVPAERPQPSHRGALVERSGLPGRDEPLQGITRPGLPSYKGEPLDPDRGPGLGCFWAQVVLLAILLVATPLSVINAAPTWVSAALLIASLVLLLFVGQTVIFLLRLVAADRRSRRRPLGGTARKTVGQLEDESAHDGDAPRTDGSA